MFRALTLLIIRRSTS